MNLVELMTEFKSRTELIDYDKYMDGGIEFVRAFDEHYIHTSKREQEKLDSAILRGVLIGLEIRNQLNDE